MTGENRSIWSKCIVCAVFLIVMMLGQVQVYGASELYATGRVNDTDGVNIRSTYSTAGSIVGGVPYQGSLLITKERFTAAKDNDATTRWYYVQSGYGNGWVRSDLLDVTYDAVKGKVTEAVKVRTGAGTSFKELTTLSEGDMVDVVLTAYTSGGVKWYKALYNDTYCFVHAAYVELQEQEDDEPVTGPVLNTEFEKELAAFPASYQDALRKLHEKYPTWHFKAGNIGFTWKEALAKQTSNYGTNTIPSSKPDSYKAVAEATYDFDNHYYYGFDGSSWVAASKKAVAYYMDPRNWLDEISIFMFESLSYDPASQKESMVKELLSSTAIPLSYSSSYMAAGVAYDISPVYLAAKSKLELGSSSYMVDGHQFTYGGKKYKGYYNAYNIGAYDSASGNAALNGLYYAASGSTYLRPWNTLDKAIRGGAMFIAEDFIGNNQHTAYYEHFNVANSLSEVGTHVYMTNTMAAATHANITYWDYRDNGMIDTSFTFEIPVFQSMPDKPAAAPGSGNNNCYLDSIKVYNGDSRLYFKTSFNRFTSSYTLKNSVGAEVDTLTIKATPNASDAKVKITGNTDLAVGDNTITVKVTSSAGIVKNYKISVTKLNTSKVVVAPEIKLSSDAATGKPKISWEKAINADEYKVYRSTSKTGSYTLLKTTTDLSYTDKKAETGRKYYYKVKSVGKTGVTGEAVSTIKYRTCDLPQPVVTTGNRASDGKPQLKWETVADAVKYEIYRSDSKDGTYTLMHTQKGNTYTNTKNVEPGTRYYYQVRALHDNTAANSANSNAVSRFCDLPRLEITSGNRASDGKPQVMWEPMEGAAKYQVYRSDTEDGTYTSVLITSKTTYTHTKAELGVTYYYKVKAISAVTASANGALSTSCSATCILPSPAVTGGNRASDGKPQLTWNAVEGADSYEVYRATSKSGEYRRMLSTTSQKYTNTSAKAGNTYYYKVKAISAEMSDINSAYSEIVTRTCDLPRPIVHGENRPSDGKPRLTWEAVDGAASYQVYRATKEDGSYTRMFSTTGQSYTNTSAKAGKTYYYKVKAISEVKSAANSAYSVVQSITVE